MSSLAALAVHEHVDVPADLPALVEDPAAAAPGCARSSARSSSTTVAPSSSCSPTPPALALSGPRSLTCATAPSYGRLHPEDAVADVAERRAGARRERLGEHVARVARVDDAVVPQARGGVDRAALVLVLLAQPRAGLGLADLAS